MANDVERVTPLDRVAARAFANALDQRARAIDWADDLARQVEQLREQLAIVTAERDRLRAALAEADAGATAVLRASADWEARREATIARLRSEGRIPPGRLARDEETR